MNIILKINKNFRFIVVLLSLLVFSSGTLFAETENSDLSLEDKFNDFLNCCASKFMELPLKKQLALGALFVLGLGITANGVRHAAKTAGETLGSILGHTIFFVEYHVSKKFFPNHFKRKVNYYRDRHIARTAATRTSVATIVVFRNKFAPPQQGLPLPPYQVGRLFDTT